jgi:hypothetical protein
MIRTAPTRDMLEQILKKISDKSINVNAVYFPTDSFLASVSKIQNEYVNSFICRSIMP